MYHTVYHKDILKYLNATNPPLCNEWTNLDCVNIAQYQISLLSNFFLLYTHFATCKAATDTLHSQMKVLIITVFLCPAAYHWEATEWTADTLITDLETTNRQHSPTPPPLPVPLALTPKRLGGSVRLGGSTHSLETSYPLRRYEGHRDFYSSLSRKCPVPECEECQEEESLPQRSYNEGLANASCYQSNLMEERLHVWKDSHSFGSHREISRLGDRRSFGAKCSHSNQHSPSMPEADRYKHY